ncbi:MAG: hypothetical protein WD058_09165, partial [Dehalococcoidia bacterium]
AMPFESEIRLILTAAMVLFIYTVVIGILNGMDLVEFERKALLAHLHVGTLGWITMAVFAGALALFGTAEAERQDWLRWTARLSPAAALVYNVAFLTTTGMLRPIAGAVMLAVIVVMGAWGFAQARTTVLSVPHLGILAGLATSVIGAVLGVLLGVMIADPDAGITDGVAGAHPATMVVGFLVPVGMAFAEWLIRPGSIAERATRAGQAQIALPFLGGVSLMLGELLGVLPLTMISLPLEIGGLGIFLWRMAPAARRISWLDASPARHGVVAGLYLVVNIAILAYMIPNYAEDFEAAPRRLVLALDHSIFIGGLTMAILGFIALRSTAVRPPWVDHVVFWGLTAGVTGFIVGLLSDTDMIIRGSTPVLGLAILFALGVHLAAAAQRMREPAAPVAA